jgi:F1F0 ATPase subunit 2
MQYARMIKMTSSEILILFLSASAGLMLGGIFFGGLWWTVRNGINAKQPGLWFLGSMIVRMTIVMAGFYIVGGGQWDRLLSCLLGFIAARSMVVWLTRPPHPTPLPRSTGGEGARRSSIPSTLVGKNGATEPLVRLPKESHHAT